MNPRNPPLLMHNYSLLLQDNSFGPLPAWLLKFNCILVLLYEHNTIKKVIKMYPLLLRLALSLALKWLKVSIREFVRRYLFISPMATPLLTPEGWWDLAWMYACLLVGLMCVSISNLLVERKVGPL